MKKIIIPVLIAVLLVTIKAEKKLKQIVILSRHNVRTPLFSNATPITTKNWSQWKSEPGYLTAKGEVLEEFMGKYFAEWLQKEKLITANCTDDLYVYANSRQRTIATAAAFLKGFSICSTIIRFKGSFDLVFEPVFKNDTDIFKQIVTEEMNNNLKTLQLNESLEILQRILDYTNSDNCKNNGKCNLVNDENNVINIEARMQPDLDGPLKVANTAIDSFIMQYYEGNPVGDITWGQINDDEWRKLMKLFQAYHYILFESSTLAARDISSLLLNNITNIFLEGSPKISLLVGHDANLMTLMKAMNIEPLNLGEFEKTPCGSKLLFQKWFDTDSGEDLLKIEFVYRPKEDMRNAVMITEDNLPKRVTLEIEGCKTNDHGYCKWDDFKDVLNNF